MHTENLLQKYTKYSKVLINVRRPLFKRRKIVFFCICVFNISYHTVHIMYLVSISVSIIPRQSIYLPVFEPNSAKAD